MLASDGSHLKENSGSSRIILETIVDELNVSGLNPYNATKIRKGSELEELSYPSTTPTEVPLST